MRREDLHPINFGWHSELQSQVARVLPIFRMPNLAAISAGHQHGHLNVHHPNGDGQYHVVSGLSKFPMNIP